MKKSYSISHSVIVLLTIIALVSLSIALSHTQEPPPADDIELEVGSTNGITILAFIITAVIVLPLLNSGAFKKDTKKPKK